MKLLIVQEFLKELAALSMEHALLALALTALEGESSPPPGTDRDHAR
jgi:hypothetical protein